jgi:hypothetical protein
MESMWLKGVFVEVKVSGTFPKGIVRGYCISCTTYREEPFCPSVPQEPFDQIKIDNYLNSVKKAKVDSAINYGHNVRLKYIDENEEVVINNINVELKDLKISIPSITEQMLLKLELDI